MDKKLRQARKKGEGKKNKSVETAATTAAAATEGKPAPVAKVAKEIKGGLPKMPSLPKASRARKPKPFVECACGCKGQTRGRWVPGHDARARGWAIRIERDICKMKDVPENEQAGAKIMLKERKELGTSADGIKLVKGKAAEAETATDPAVNQ